MKKRHPMCIGSGHHIRSMKQAPAIKATFTNHEHSYRKRCSWGLPGLLKSRPPIMTTSSQQLSYHLLTRKSLLPQLSWLLQSTQSLPLQGLANHLTLPTWNPGMQPTIQFHPCQVPDAKLPRFITPQCQQHLATNLPRRQLHHLDNLTYYRDTLTVRHPTTGLLVMHNSLSPTLSPRHTRLFSGIPSQSSPFRLNNIWLPCRH